MTDIDDIDDTDDIPDTDDIDDVDDMGDDLERSLDEDGDGAVVDGLTGVLAVCGALRGERLAAGLSMGGLAARCACDIDSLEWVDEGDVAAPVEALVYYAAALGWRLQLRLGR